MYRQILRDEGIKGRDTPPPGSDRRDFCLFRIILAYQKSISFSAGRIAEQLQSLGPTNLVTCSNDQENVLGLIAIMSNIRINSFSADKRDLRNTSRKS
jgi:hypothetical protein